MINEFRFQYGRDFEFQKTQPAFPGEPVSSQGISPQITISGSAGIVFGNRIFWTGAPTPTKEAFSFADTYSVSRGKHMFKFGGDVVRFNDVLDSLFQESGAYNYNNRVDFISDYTVAVDALAQPACGTTTKVACYSNYVQGFGPPRFEFSDHRLWLFLPG